MSRALLFLYLLAAMSSAIAGGKGLNVSVRTVAQVAYFPQGSAPATTLSLNDATLSAQIQSAIMDIPVMVADTVNRGDILVNLDCRNNMAVKQSNQAKLSLAEYQLQRASKLSKDKHISEEILRTRQSEIVIARSALKVSSINVERCRVVAPFRGVVTQRVADVGEWVNQGEPLMQLVDLDHVEVSAQLPDLLINNLDNIPKFDFVVGSGHFPLQLRKISDVVDKAARTREVRLQFSGKRAHPGQSGRLVWEQAHRYLPSSFLVSRNNEYGVFIVQDNRARFVAVPDAQEGRPVSVDLATDVLLIDKGRHSVKENDPVNIIR